MILSDSVIKKLVEDGVITIDPAPAHDQYDTSSVDLRLGGKFFRYKERYLKESPGVEPPVFDPDSFDFTSMSEIYLEDLPTDDDGSAILEPQRFILAMTRERIFLPPNSRIAARVEGRSTLARIGLSIHLTAPTVHLGFRGRLTLEIKNHGVLRVRLRPGMVICQLIFERVEGSPSKEIGTSFQNQQSPHGS